MTVKVKNSKDEMLKDLTKACNRILNRKFPSTKLKMISGRTDYAAPVANFLARGGKVTKLSEGHAQYAIKFYEFDGWRGGLNSIHDDEAITIGEEDGKA